MIVFMICNNILMLNIAIAIIIVSFNLHNENENGLFYDKLIWEMSGYEYDDEFGFIVCEWTPLHNFLIFMIPII